MDSCGHHEYIHNMGLFILISGVHVKDAFHTCALHQRLEDWHNGHVDKSVCKIRTNWRYVDVHTDPRHAPSDDKIYVMLTLADSHRLMCQV